MVCSLGSGRMAVMARLLAAGGFSRSIVEEVGHQKLAANLICRELSEADEPNLLDEEDMHVFGLKPMADNLHLVCCNTCKKPVQASQYVAHAEFCRMLNSTEESTQDVNGSVGHRKPLRKEKKKSLNAYANQTISVGELAGSESVDADAAAVAESQLNGQIGMNSSFSMEAKRNSANVDAKHLMDGSGVCSGNTDNSRATKRSKLIAGEWLPLSDDLERASGVSKIISTQDECFCQVSPKQTIAQNGNPDDYVVGHKKPDQIYGCCLPMKEIPVPLATKIYYSQRSNRLRSSLCHLYYEAVASTEEFCRDKANTKLSNENMYQSQASYQKYTLLKQAKELNSKESLLPSVQTPDQILAQSSEVCLGTSGVCPPPNELSKKFPVDNFPRSQVAPVGLARNKYLSKPYSFAGNSGQPLGAVQQQNGSVPVL